MQKLLVLIFIGFVFAGCKTIKNTSDESASLRAKNDNSFEDIYNNALVLTASNLDSLLDFFKGEYTRGDLERYMNQGYRWNDGWYKMSDELIKLGWVMEQWQSFNTVLIYPNPTSSFVTVILFKNMTESMEVNGTRTTMYDHLNLQQYFSFTVSVQLLFDSKTVWTYQTSNCYGEIVIDESVLQKAGTYLLVVEIDGYRVSENFMVVKKQ